MKLKFFAAIAAFLLIAGGTLTVVVARDGSGSKGQTVAERDGGRDRDGKYGSDPRKEAAFENARGGEADRNGPQNPAVEQVGNRAYPRNYVDDRLAIKSRARPSTPSPSRVKAARARAVPHAQQARAQARACSSRSRVAAVSGRSRRTSPGGIAVPDPVTSPDPHTGVRARHGAGNGPDCARPAGRRPAASGVAAAGGGIWRTDDALRCQPTESRLPTDLTTNAFGSLIDRPTDPTGHLRSTQAAVS